MIESGETVLMCMGTHFYCSESQGKAVILGFLNTMAHGSDTQTVPVQWMTCTIWPSGRVSKHWTGTRRLPRTLKLLGLGWRLRGRCGREGDRGKGFGMRAMVVGEARREAGGKRTAVDKFIKIVDGKWEYTFTGEQPAVFVWGSSSTGEKGPQIH